MSLLPSSVDDSRPTPRTLTQGVFPRYIDAAQIPIKPEPFRALRAQKWVQSLNLIVPASESGNTLWKELSDGSDAYSIKYAKVIMTLGDVLDGDFFTEYIKKGNIMMMSEGRRGVDNRFELFEGVLRLELDKPTYERVGIAGKAIRDGGLKHKKYRYAIHVDLREPSMLHGKKGFDRLVSACKHVLNNSMTWVFYDFSTSSLEGASPIDKHHPRWFSSSAMSKSIKNISPPDLSPLEVCEGSTYLEERQYLIEVEEWFSLVALGSSRLVTGDDTNPFICRYKPPIWSFSGVEPRALNDTNDTQDLLNLQWSGFLPTTFVLKLLLATKRSMRGHGCWALMTKGLRDENDLVTVIGTTQDVEGESRYICYHWPR